MSKKNTVTYHSAEQFELLSMIPCTRSGLEYAGALDVKQGYKLARDEDGKVLKDAAGNAVKALDKTGQPILQTLTLVPKPHESDKRDDMADAAKKKTGKAVVGQALMEFEKAAQRELFEAMIADLTADFESEQVVPVSVQVNVRTGAKSYRTKPLTKPPQLSRGEIKALAEANGMKVIDVQATVVKEEPAKPLSKKAAAAIAKKQAELEALKKQAGE